MTKSEICWSVKIHKILIDKVFWQILITGNWYITRVKFYYLNGVLSWCVSRFSQIRMLILDYTVCHYVNYMTIYYVMPFVWFTMCCSISCTTTGLILCLCPTNERRRYKVTPSLIDWAQTYYQPWIIYTTGFWWGICSVLDLTVRHFCAIDNVGKSGVMVVVVWGSDSTVPNIPSSL